MTEEDGANISISYPAPPPFYKLYHEDDGVRPLPPLPPPPVPGKLIIFGRMIDPVSHRVRGLQPDHPTRHRHSTLILPSSCDRLQDEGLVPPNQAAQLYQIRSDASVGETQHTKPAGTN